jgi:hypothetical protein
MGIQMVDRWLGYLHAGKSKVRVLFEPGETVVFTKPYVKHTLFSQKKYNQGRSVIVTNIHQGLCGEITHVDVRLKEGNFLYDVPIDYFRA